MPLTFKLIEQALQAKTLHKAEDFESRSVGKIVACDLMSDVLVEEGEDFLIITYLASEQVARTADMVNAAGILLVGGKAPQPALVRTAAELNISLLTTPMGCYEACVALGRISG